MNMLLDMSAEEIVPGDLIGLVLVSGLFADVVPVLVVAMKRVDLRGYVVMGAEVTLLGFNGGLKKVTMLATERVFVINRPGDKT